MAHDVALTATCWTTAGSAGPLIGNDLSEFRLVDRITAAAVAGYTGFGLLLEDLKAVENTDGWSRVRDHLRASGIQHVEFELLNNWLRAAPPRRQSDDDAAYLLRPSR